jgi:hypothetical protein
MKNLSLLEKLDATLKYCIDNENKDLIQYFKSNHNEMDELLDKLERDGFIKRDKNLAKEINDIHGKPTIEGRMFYDKGGYERQAQMDKLHETVSFLNNKRIIRNEEMLVHATAVAIIVGLAILGWQIFVWFFPHYNDFLHR